MVFRFSIGNAQEVSNLWVVLALFSLAGPFTAGAAAPACVFAPAEVHDLRLAAKHDHFGLWWC